MASQSLGLPLWDAVPRGCGRGDAAWRAAALACPGRGSRRPPARPVLAGQQLRRWGPGRVISSPELSRTQGLTSRQGLRGRKGRQRPSFHEHRPAAGSALSGPGCTPKAPLQDRGDGGLREGNCPPLLLGSGDRGPSQVLHVGSHYRGGDRVRKALWVIGKDTGAPGKCHQLKRAPICSCFRLSEPSPAGPLNGEGGPRSRPMRPLREAGAPPPTLCISWRSMPTPGALSAGPGLLLCPAASCSGPDAQGCQATGGREERGFPGCVASLCLIFRDLVC